MVKIYCSDTVDVLCYATLLSCDTCKNCVPIFNIFFPRQRAVPLSFQKTTTKTTIIGAVRKIGLSWERGTVRSLHEGFCTSCFYYSIIPVFIQNCFRNLCAYYSDLDGLYSHLRPGRYKRLFDCSDQLISVPSSTHHLCP